MRALKQSVYYGIGIVMMKGVSLLMMPYVTGQLSTHEYGSLESLILLADIGTIVIGFGLIEALYRFVGASEGIDREQLISNCFTLSAIVAIAGCCLIWLIMPWLLARLPQTLEAYQVLLIAIPTSLEGLIAIPLTLMRMQSLAKWFCIYSVIKAVVQAALMVAMLEVGMGIDAILIASAISSVCLLSFLLRFQWQQMTRFGYLGYSKSILKFSAPIVLSCVGLFAITGLDRWILADQVGVETLAVYAIAGKFALILALLMQPFSLWWFPNRIQTLQQKNGEQLCAENAILGTNIGIFVATTMALTVPSFITLFLPVEYHLSAKIVLALLLVNAVKNAGELLNLGCFSGNSSQGQMWIQWLCSVIAIAGYWWLIPLLGIWAAVGVLGFVYGLRLILIYRLSQSLLPLPYKHANWIKTVIVGAGGYTISFLISPILNLWQQMLCGVLLSTFILVILIRWQVFPDIIQIVRKSATALNAKRIRNRYVG